MYMDWLLRGPGPKGTTPTIFPYENIDFFAPNVFKEAQPWESSQLPVMVWVCCCKWCALVAALQRPSAHDFHRTPGDDLFGTILGGGFKDFCFTPGKPPTENSISVVLPSFHIHHHLNHLVFLGYVTLTWSGPVLSHFGVVIQGRCSLAAAPSCLVRWQQRRCLQLTSVSFMAWYGEANLRKPQTWKQTMKLQSINVKICWVPFGYFDWAEKTYFGSW